jgi:hypothetical protein
VSFRLPSITSYSDRSGSPESAILKTQSDLEAAERFWDIELVRFNEMRIQATEALLKHQRDEIDADANSVPRPVQREGSASKRLRKKAGEAARQSQVTALSARADRVDAVEFEFAKARRLAVVRARGDALRAKHVEELAVLNRRWDERLKKLKVQMKRDLESKTDILARSGGTPRAFTSRQERTVFRRSCPNSIIATISPRPIHVAPMTASEDER